MNRRTLVRGIQLVVAITLVAFVVIAYGSVQGQREGLAVAWSTVRPGWLVLACLLALQEGVWGGTRMYVLCRVLTSEIRWRTAVVSEFVLMFCAGVTPGQVGAAPSQVAVLVHSGMKLSDLATAELLTASTTILFFLLTAASILGLRSFGLLAFEGGKLDLLIGVSIVFFGSGLIALFLCVAYPPLLKAVLGALGRVATPLVRLALSPLTLLASTRAFAERSLAKPGRITARLRLAVDEMHEGFSLYLQRGKLAYLAAFGSTVVFFCSRFAVAYFILLGLGLPTEPSTFVAIGPPIVQVILIQALLNFALYLSPTPGASGIAEAGSASLMAPWVRGAYELPYVVLWRGIAMFLCMFVGGIYVFRYLGTDVLEEQVKEAEAAKRALQEEKLARLP